MKILVLGAVNGNIDLVNKYAEETKADKVLCVGNFGIHYRNYADSNFFEYIEGRKKFLVPTFVMRGVNDNISLYDNLIDDKLMIDNFVAMADGNHYHEIEGIVVGGTGGSYSPVAYSKERLIGNDKRHFNKKTVDWLKSGNCDILLMNDLIDECTKKKIIYTEETHQVFSATKAKYCFVGKYDWWGYSDMWSIVVVIMPNATKGYMKVDTKTWDSKATRFDIEEKNG